MLSDAATRIVPLLPTVCAMTTGDPAAAALAVAEGLAEGEDDELVDVLVDGWDPHAARVSPTNAVAPIDLMPVMLTSPSVLQTDTKERYPSLTRPAGGGNKIRPCRP